MTPADFQSFNAQVQRVIHTVWAVTVNYHERIFSGAAGAPSASAALLGDGGGYGATRALMLHIRFDVATAHDVRPAENERVGVRRADGEEFEWWRIAAVKRDGFARQWVLTLQDEST
ncbi:MAG: hypothetical protein LBK76_03465 [Verrucomicrobiales bacterium]|jgi:hypothetical protein|nr:hypothetical protein [Verrucomicrobiales bacterium]